MTKEEILSKRILKFPEAPNMTDEAIKRNVGNAMQEYADLRCKPLVEALEKIFEINTDFHGNSINMQSATFAREALQDYNKK